MESSVDFEKKYKKYEFTAQPKVTDVKVNIAIYPQNRTTKAAGIFTIVNKSTGPIESLILNISSPVDHTIIEKLSVDGSEPKLVMEDKVNRFFIYKMPKTMQPGDTMKMDITMDAGFFCFTNSGLGRQIVYNGTFFDLSIFPSFGYPGDPIDSDKERKKHGLPKKDYTLPPQTDPHGLSNLLFNDDADYVTFEATVSTDEDQIALAPGYL